jgi:hypothetical protein
MWLETFLKSRTTNRFAHHPIAKITPLRHYYISIKKTGKGRPVFKYY